MIPIVQSADTQLSCAQIQAEVKINNERIQTLAVEQNWKMGQNAVAGIVGFAIWPAWLGLDLQNAAGKDAQALTHRNEYLLMLAKDRCRPMSQTASIAPNARLSADLPFAPAMASASLASSAGLTTSLVER